MLRRFFAGAVALAFAFVTNQAAFAQQAISLDGAVHPSWLGQYTSSGCPSNLTWCFVPYSASNPFPTTLSPTSPGIITTGQTTKANSIPTVPASDYFSDPCLDPQTVPQSASISITSATTTQLISASGSTAVYICGGQVVIPGSATTAASAQLEYGTTASCAAGTTVLTGAMGSNDAAVSTTPTVVSLGAGNRTSMQAPASNGVCLVSLGNAVKITGWISYVQK